MCDIRGLLNLQTIRAHHHPAERQHWSRGLRLQGERDHGDRQGLVGGQERRAHRPPPAGSRRTERRRIKGT